MLYNIDMIKTFFELASLLSHCY